jgi:hypothetical protein
MKELVYSVKVATRNELLGRILEAADKIRSTINRIGLPSQRRQAKQYVSLLAATSYSPKPARLSSTTISKTYSHSYRATIPSAKLPNP